LIHIAALDSFCLSVFEEKTKPKIKSQIKNIRPNGNTALFFLTELQFKQEQEVFSSVRVCLVQSNYVQAYIHQVSNIPK